MTDGSAEWNYTASASANDAGVLASDWLNNGATHASLSQGWTERLVNPTKSDATALPNNTAKHTAAFVFTDGDNICSDLNLLLDRTHWADPTRGSVPTGFGLNPTLAAIAPVGLQAYYEEATQPNDSFIAFSALYAFPDKMSAAGRQQWAELTAQAMDAAGHARHELHRKCFNTTDFAPLLNQWNIDGIVYFDYYGPTQHTLPTT